MDKAKILRLLDEADDIVSALYRQGANKDYKCKKLREKLEAIAAEISEPPKTNADRIRQMTDEELAKLLYDVDTNICNFCAAQRSNVFYDCEEESCEKSVLAWLKQEVKTNDERGQNQEDDG